MAPRKGTRTKLGRRKRPRNRLEELTERARQEGRSLTRRERRERRRDMRARSESVEISLRLRGTALGNRRFAAGLVVCGVLGLAVTIAIDLPRGLDAGRNALAFYGAEAQLLGGFWAEVAASATLIFCGCLLPLYSRDLARPKRRQRVRRSRASHRDVGGMAPGLRAES